MLSVKDTIDKYNLLKKGETIGCAVSGGSDSMALLHFMLSIKDCYGIKVVCANVEHGIRGNESISDTEFVKDYCEKNGVPFICKGVDAISYANENGINLEQAARRLRYAFFYSLIEGGECNKVFIAHNKKDNVETVFLNILRGSGSRGVYGMDIDNGRGIIRPMLNTDKPEIMRYIADNGIKYVTDSTNADNSYSRNYLRNEIFPLLESRFDNFYGNVLRFAAIVREDGDYLDYLCENYIVKEGGGYYIKLPCNGVMLKHAAMVCCKRLGAVKDIESSHLAAVTGLAGKESGSMLNLSNGINVYKDYGRLYFEKFEKDKSDGNKIPFCTGKFTLGGYEIEISEANNIEKAANTLYFDGRTIDTSCVFRFRKEGDSFKRFKGKSKSLSDFLTDVKAPKRIRDTLPLLCRGSEVLILIPYDISDGVKVTNESKKIYKIFYRRTGK